MKNSQLKDILKLEESFGKTDFSRNYRIFFTNACNQLDIPDHIIKSLLKSKDPLIKDSVLWKYFSLYQMNTSYREFNCFKIDKQKMKERHDKVGLRIDRLESFGRIDRLPSKEIYNNLSAFAFIDNKPYILTLSKTFFKDQEGDDFYSEQKWINKEAAILIALINLSNKAGWYNFFIGDDDFYIPLSYYDLDIKKLDKISVNKIRKLFKLYEFIDTKINNDGKEIQNNFSYGADIIIKNVENLNKKIDRKNSVLLRCLYCFAKACSFTSHKMTTEESTALQLICLEGLYKLFMTKYKLSKVQDVSIFLKTKFDCPYGEYVDELYGERTIYVHPENNQGDYWCPPWNADTCYDTLPIVKELLLLYITGNFKKTNFY